MWNKSFVAGLVLWEEGVEVGSVCDGVYGFSKRTDLLLLLQFGGGLYSKSDKSTICQYFRKHYIMVNFSLFPQQLLNCKEKQNLWKKSV